MMHHTSKEWAKNAKISFVGGVAVSIIGSVLALANIGTETDLSLYAITFLCFAIILFTMLVYANQRVMMAYYMEVSD